MNQLAPAKTIFVLVAVFFGTCLTAYGQPEGVRLAWKWNPGEKLKMEMEQEVSINMDISGQKVESKVTTRTWMTWEVTGTDDDGNGLVNTVVDRIAMHSVNPMGNVKYDSDVESDDPKVEAIARNFRHMVGAATTQTISSRGEVLELEFPDELKNSLTELGGEASVKMFEDVSRNATLLFPEQPLKVGDFWDKRVETATPQGNITLDSTYTYKGLATVESGEFHQFDVKVNMSFANEAITIDNQNTKGALFFDSEAGRIDHSRVEQLVEMTVSQGGQVIKQSLTQVATVKITAQ